VDVYRSILVAYDDSDGARAALARAAELASSFGAALTLVESVAGGELPLIGREQARSAASGRESLRAAIATLSDDLPADPWVVSGPAGRSVLAVADEIAADLIVSGSRGRRGLTRAVLGSVSGEIAAGASCDVLIVHPPEG
jgi:nucleotide-binding universal stress UspA family protein